MQDYRIYLVPKRAGIATPSIILRLHSDDEAIAAATAMITATHSAEIWRQDRLIFRVPSTSAGKATRPAPSAEQPLIRPPARQETAPAGAD